MELARELLTESGSFFMQIGDVNLHRCALIADEVFGAANHVTTIIYRTTGGGSSTKSIAKAGDHILWYARDRDAMLFQTLHEERPCRVCASQATYSGGDFPDGVVL